MGDPVFRGRGRALSPEHVARLRAVVAKHGAGNAKRLLGAGWSTLQEAMSGGRVRPDVAERLEKALDAQGHPYALSAGGTARVGKTGTNMQGHTRGVVRPRSARSSVGVMTIKVVNQDGR